MISKQLLQEVALEQEERLAKDAGTKWVAREALEKVRQFERLPHSVVIAGIRRSGKSTLLLQTREYIPEGGYYCNFEDERLLGFSVHDFQPLYEVFLERFGEKKTFFFDEIQNVPGWERFVSRMHTKGFKFYLTGSNASLLSREFGTRLTGRHVTVSLYPFSFREFLKHVGHGRNEDELLKASDRASLRRHFRTYLQEGGMPEYLVYQKPETLTEVYHDILYRDIVARYDIRDERSLRELGLYLMSNHSTLVSLSGLKRFLQLGSVNTVKNFLRYFENSFLFFTIPLYSRSFKQQAVTPKKVYCIDQGFIRFLGFKASEDRGRLLENIVFLELKRRGEELFYYRTQNNGEVDLVIRKGTSPKQLIQVCWNISDPRTRDREVKSLSLAMEELGVRDGLILTDDEQDTIHVDKKTIQVKPVYQWLLAGKKE